jgi:hypothetical protein
MLYRAKRAMTIAPRLRPLTVPLLAELEKGMMGLVAAGLDEMVPTPPLGEEPVGYGAPTPAAADVTGLDPPTGARPGPPVEPAPAAGVVKVTAGTVTAVDEPDAVTVMVVRGTDGMLTVMLLGTPVYG